MKLAVASYCQQCQTTGMPEQQLSVRSSKARARAHSLAKREGRTVSQIVERALERYAQGAGQPADESAATFWARIVDESRNEDGPDFDIDALLQKSREPQKPVTF